MATRNERKRKAKAKHKAIVALAIRVNAAELRNAAKPANPVHERNFYAGIKSCVDTSVLMGNSHTSRPKICRASGTMSKNGAKALKAKGAYSSRQDAA